MTWDGDISRMGALSDRVADLAEVPSRAAARIASELEDLIHGEFDGGEDPYGQGWESLAQATLDKGRTPPPLTDTRAMRNSLAVRPMQRAGVSITIAHPAAPHQTGWHGTQGAGPSRPILPMREMPASWEGVINDAIEKEFRRAG